MTGDTPGGGAFPVSFGMGWHGGLHLDAPTVGSKAEPVRAIADGEVVMARQADPQPPGPLSPTDPQAYNGWTDNGVVVIRHTTEIGEGPNAAVIFYSVYMHLSELDPAVKAKRQIYRKDRLGSAGQIYGSIQRRIHFEIFCDDVNLQKFIGRASGDLSLAGDGRLDAVYGNLYFVLPAGAQFYSQKPLDHLTQAYFQPPATKPHAPPPPKVLLQPAYTSNESDGLVVVMRYACGEGAEGHRGSAYLNTLKLDGSTVGNGLEEVDAEYNLYKRANEISNAYPAGEHPAPSAVYELLRFGRIVNAPEETLSPTDAPHWRKVAYPGGVGWINLNATGVRKFSDADFPHWTGWTLADDSSGSTGSDSRCDSATIKGWLDSDSDSEVTLTEAAAKLKDANVIKKLSKVICKFPTEWDASTIDARWGWLKSQTTENSEPLNDTEFGLLSEHIKKLAFWSSDIGTESVIWHWQPREFIRHMRLCGWMSIDELASSLPKFSHFSDQGTLRSYLSSSSITLDSARSRFRIHYIALNKCIRKYMIQSQNRKIHFLAQTFIETDRWKVVSEYGSGTPVASIPMIEYYAAFYGRGIMQLTWAANFEVYGEYRDFPSHSGAYSDPRITSTSKHYWGDPTLRDEKKKIIGLDPKKPPRQWAPRYDPILIKGQSYNANDSGGFYWVWKSIGNGESNINRACDAGLDPSATDRISKLVNGGGFGYFERQGYVAYLARHLSDSIDSSKEAIISTPRQSTSVKVNFSRPE